MSGQLALSFALKFNDQGSGPASRALQLLTRGLKETESTAKATSATIAPFPVLWHGLSSSDLSKPEPSMTALTELVLSITLLVGFVALLAIHLRR